MPHIADYLNTYQNTVIYVHAAALYALVLLPLVRAEIHRDAVISHGVVILIAEKVTHVRHLR
jgi:hypothetical protein